MRDWTGTRVLVLLVARGESVRAVTVGSSGGNGRQVRFRAWLSRRSAGAPATRH